MRNHPTPVPTQKLAPGSTVKIPESITVKKLAEILGVPIAKVITELLRNKILATINDEIDFETASIITQDLGFTTEKDLTVKQGEVLGIEKLEEICRQEKESGKNLRERPPIVTILGHVDHGKTTLLDTIRKTNVVASEAGGITQHISAYQTKKRGKVITFVDTPGHEAFSAMRERGVSLADIAILVIAADDGVRPQTKEVIAYLKEKKVPTVVAITKIDKPDANIQRAKQGLAENDILIEEWGGSYVCSEVSAKTGKGLDDLLDSILLVAEVEDFRADMKRDGFGVVLEAHLDPNKGPVATVLVKTGVLKVGHDVLMGQTAGRIRRIEDWTGKSIQEATPSMPVTLMGLEAVPNANDVVQVTISRSRSKDLLLPGSDASHKQKFQRVAENDPRKKVKVVLKADTQGSLEAIEQILATFRSDEVMIQFIGAGVGSITESDVKIAETADTLITGFNVEATAVARRLAEESKVEIKTYKIIYELVDEIKKRMESLLEPEIIRTDLGELEVLAVFKTGKKDMIVGGSVKKGRVLKGCFLEIRRGESIIGRGRLQNLQQNKVDVNEVKQGQQCGITFDGETKMKIGDILVFFLEEQKKKFVETV